MKNGHVYSEIWHDEETGAFYLTITVDGKTSQADLEARDYISACAEADNLIHQIRLQLAQPGIC